MIMQELVDFGEILPIIQSYRNPTNDSTIPTINETGFIDLTASLLHEIAKRNGNPDATKFVVHPELLKHAMEHDDFYPLETREHGFGLHGQPVVPHPTMPENRVLCFAPDALTFGGKVIHPWMVAIGKLSDRE